ncbi:unnamed protein product [Ilex paraguariensis]|uniref:PARP-type domain-containing protein n=1 Tax=Ilex paraguariensis TaxID=185542 RepID=A0ABC8S3C2_9AQUA
MASSNVIAEYAKSGRSSCKKCSKTIAKDAPRLGLVSRDSRGFDMTKWHHLECFPSNSASINALDAIKGFSSFKGSDQEALKKVVNVGEQSKEKVSDGDENAFEGSREKIGIGLKVRKRDGNEERTLKKQKLATPNEASELEVAFSVSDVKDKYKNATLSSKWKAFQTIIFLERDDRLHDSEKIAAFDFDGCLAKTSVKRVGSDAWSLMYPSIPEKLQSLYNDGYKLLATPNEASELEVAFSVSDVKDKYKVIFTNESNIERWKNKRQVAVDSKIGRLNSFIEEVKVPIQVFIACGYDKSNGQAEDPFRKPKPGMWRIMQQHFNSGIAVDMNQSFYVGDAAGRPDDHSDADIKFAQLSCPFCLVVCSHKSAHVTPQYQIDLLPTHSWIILYVVILSPFYLPD